MISSFIASKQINFLVLLTPVHLNTLRVTAALAFPGCWQQPSKSDPITENTGNRAPSIADEKHQPLVLLGDLQPQALQPVHQVHQMQAHLALDLRDRLMKITSMYS